VLEIPVLDERDILRSNGATAAAIVRERCPPERDGIGSAFSLDAQILKERFDRVRQLEVVLFGASFTEDLIFVSDALVLGREPSNRDRMDHGVEVIGRKIGIFGPNVQIVRLVVDWDVHSTRQRVVKVRESDLVLGTDLLSDNDLVDVIELDHIERGLLSA
jgi:hypothetical protein